MDDKLGGRHAAMEAFQFFPDALGLLWGLLGGTFNLWMTQRLLGNNMSNGRIFALVFLKPVTHLVILVCGMFVSAWFMLLAAAGDLLMLAVMFLKNYFNGRR